MERWEKELAEIRAILDRTARRQEETARRQEEADRQHAKWVAEAEERHRRHAKWMAEADRRHAKLVEEENKRFAKMRKENRKLIDDLAAQMKETRATLTGVGISNGMVAEDVVFEAMGKRLMFGGVKFDRIGRAKADIVVLPDGRRIEGEFDIILYNCTSFAMIDVKYRVRKDDLDYLVDVQMPKFKVVFPQYKDYKVYLGIGGMTFDKGVMEAALKRGIGVLKLGDNLVKEVRDENVKVW